jgi:HlyD family secretion protein
MLDRSGKWQMPCHANREPQMDNPRKSAAKKRVIRRILMSVLLVGIVGVVSVVLGRLKPAAPPVEMSTVWPDTVKRGPMLRDVRGLGTLVPEDTLLIPATTDGRVERILVRPGTPVTPETVILTLDNPTLQNDLLGAEFALKAAEAQLADLRIQLQSTTLTQKALVAASTSDYHTAQLKADRDAQLSKEGLVPEVDAKISVVTAAELKTKMEIEQERLRIAADSTKAQIEAKQVAIEQLRGAYNLKKKEVEDLKVKAGTTGTLQALPTPPGPLEVGQKVTAGTALAKVVQPWKLKAELHIPETQAKDVMIGQQAQVDTRNGVVTGKVSRIDPSVINGTITVDVRLTGDCPPGCRPDLSVDGTVELERLNDVVFMGRPVFGQENSTVTIFRVDPDAKFATRVQVKLGRASVNAIEVKDGLKVGDRVILSDMSAFDGHDRIKLN